MSQISIISPDENQAQQTYEWLPASNNITPHVFSSIGSIELILHGRSQLLGPKVRRQTCGCVYHDSDTFLV
jgi:hypothetical protein